MSVMTHNFVLFIAKGQRAQKWHARSSIDTTRRA
jgi:hypothetical protein